MVLNISSDPNVSGKFDVAAAFDDGTFGVIDFKTTSPADKNIRLYSRQLHAYALALEHPAPGKLGLTPISLIGILAVDPVEMVSIPGGRVTLRIGGAHAIAGMSGIDAQGIQSLLDRGSGLTEPLEGQPGARVQVKHQEVSGHRKRIIFDLWLAGGTTGEIGDSLFLTQQSVWESVQKTGVEALKTPVTEDPPTYNVWNFNRCDPRFGQKHPGQIPGQIVVNLLLWLTDRAPWVQCRLRGGLKGIFRGILPSNIGMTNI